MNSNYALEHLALVRRNAMGCFITVDLPRALLKLKSNNNEVSAVGKH